MEHYLNITCARKEHVTILVETYSHYPTNMYRQNQIGNLKALEETAALLYSNLTLPILEDRARDSN